jgi:transposase
MLSFSTHCRYFLYRPATDMRKSFDGLGGIIKSETAHELLSGDVFIFINRRRDRIKLLKWDVTGFALYYKRLERGTFELPCSEDSTLELDWSALVMLLEGIEIKQAKRRKRYGRKH